MFGMDANTIGLIIIGILAAYTAWTNRQATLDRAKMALDIAATKVAAVATQAAAELTEKNTNSMKDALVAATAESSEAKGRDEERARGDLKAAAVAHTRLEGASTAAIEKGAREGTQDAVTPVAEGAVIEGTKIAITEAQQAVAPKK